MINADIALYRAKNAGRNRYEFFSVELHQAAVNTKQLADEILTGLEQKQFLPHYQPQFDAKTHEITGVEALARWQHPKRGLLLPDDFIAVAEDLNVMATIDKVILEQSLAQMRRWHRADVKVPRIAVNVSARRLQDEQLIEGLKKLKIEPGMLTFELVESVFLDESDDLVAWNIDQIKELGIDIEIDDFGTGYASIVSLMQLQPKRLKIDRQLVDPIDKSASQREMVRSIVQIGNALGIEAIGEGVETVEQSRILRDLGCQLLQGYVFAKPMSSRAFSRFARNWQKRTDAA
jgi:EAL domain-containing protein (putative c-di-GMP-specific phosphodiesterase class I)